MAESAYDKFIEQKEKEVSFPENGDSEEYFESSRIIRESAIQTIVFSAMASEAAIYDLSAIQLGDKYASKHLDKLDLLAKWLVVPRLICGKSLKSDGPAINALSMLVRHRNALVHHKSLSACRNKDQIEKVNNQIQKIIEGAEDAYKSIVLLSLELNRILMAKAGVLPFFEVNNISTFDSKRSNKVRKLIERCREIDSKHKV